MYAIHILFIHFLFAVCYIIYDIWCSSFHASLFFYFLFIVLPLVTDKLFWFLLFFLLHLLIKATVLFSFTWFYFITTSSLFCQFLLILSLLLFLPSIFAHALVVLCILCLVCLLYISMKNIVFVLYANCICSYRYNLGLQLWLSL